MAILHRKTARSLELGWLVICSDDPPLKDYEITGIGMVSNLSDDPSPKGCEITKIEADSDLDDTSVLKFSFSILINVCFSNR